MDRNEMENIVKEFVENICRPAIEKVKSETKDIDIHTKLEYLYDMQKVSYRHIFRFSYWIHLQYANRKEYLHIRIKAVYDSLKNHIEITLYIYIKSFTRTIKDGKFRSTSKISNHIYNKLKNMISSIKEEEILTYTLLDRLGMPFDNLRTTVGDKVSISGSIHGIRWELMYDLRSNDITRIIIKIDDTKKHKDIVDMLLDKLKVLYMIS